MNVGKSVPIHDKDAVETVFLRFLMRSLVILDL